MPIQANKIRLLGFSFEELMKLGEFKKLPNDTYIKYFTNEEGEKYRYHCMQTDKDTAEMHTDKLKERGQRRFHLASNYLVKQELRRLRRFLTAKIKPVKKSRNIFLPREERLKALSGLAQ